DSAQGLKPQCIDYAAWPAVAGDHSCSAKDMVSEVLSARWVLNVAAASATLKTKLAAAKRRDQRVNAIRSSDIELLRADPEYDTTTNAPRAIPGLHGPIQP